MELEQIKVAVKSDEVCFRDPLTMERLTKDGKIVRKTPFWVRALKRGDVIELPLKKEIKKTLKKKVVKDGN